MALNENKESLKYKLKEMVPTYIEASDIEEVAATLLKKN